MKLKSFYYSLLRLYQFNLQVLKLIALNLDQQIPSNQAVNLAPVILMVEELVELLNLN